MRTLAFRITNNEEIERLCESLFYGIRMNGWFNSYVEQEC